MFLPLLYRVPPLLCHARLVFVLCSPVASVMLVHVRDISHPQADFQKSTVLKVIQEVGVPPSMLKEKYIEVWNKVDLISDADEKNF